MANRQTKQMAHLVELLKQAARTSGDEDERAEAHVSARGLFLSLREEHEKRPGMVPEMQKAGWRLTHFTPGGKPNRFHKKLGRYGVVYIVKAVHGWRVERKARPGEGVIRTSKGEFQRPVKMKSPGFDDPVVLAVWVGLEAGNGQLQDE